MFDPVMISPYQEPEFEKHLYPPLQTYHHKAYGAAQTHYKSVGPT